MKTEALQQSPEYLLVQKRTGELLIAIGREMRTRAHYKPVDSFCGQQVVRGRSLAPARTYAPLWAYNGVRGRE
jgi:hypothetical protein